jgi:cell wall-associated NlpC family hydrolase
MATFSVPMPPLRRRCQVLFAAATLWLAAGLTAARAADPTNVADAGAEIVVQALALLGVPYRWGGNDPARGLDCSGLVRHVVKTVVSLELPRRSEQMSRIGQRVDRADLRAGDLLFFNTLGYPNSHVALYMGDGRFVHAPGRKSHVRVDELDERYWLKRFNGARRIDFAGATAVVVAEPERKTSPLTWRTEDFPNGP